MKPLMMAHATKVDEIAAHLKREILTGRVGPGNRLSERELSLRLSVGRGTIRESMARLASDGFIENVRGTGAFVRAYSVRDAEILFYIREVLEAASARFAASRIGRLQSDELRQLVDEMRAAFDTREVSRLAPLDAEFHGKIAEAAGSKVLQSFVATQLDLKTMIIGSAGVTSTEAVISEHSAIAEAIVLGQVDLAEQLMRSHIRRGSEANLRWMAERASNHRETRFPHGKKERALAARPP